MDISNNKGEIFKTMFIIEHNTQEFLQALERLNKQQNDNNIFVNITDEDVFKEIAKYRKNMGDIKTC